MMFDHFNLLAPIYERFSRTPEIDTFLELLDLPVSGVLLDAGGGTGRISSHLQPYVERIVVSDVSSGMITRAAWKSGVLAIQARTEYLPFRSKRFERILVVDALHHFHNQQRAISDLLRVLTPGGRLLIQEPNLHRRQVKLIAMVEKLALMRSHFYYPEEISNMIESSGATSDMIPNNSLAAWIIARKPPA